MNDEKVHVLSTIDESMTVCGVEGFYVETTDAQDKVTCIECAKWAAFRDVHKAWFDCAPEVQWVQYRKLLQIRGLIPIRPRLRKVG